MLGNGYSICEDHFILMKIQKCWIPMSHSYAIRLCQTEGIGSFSKYTSLRQAVETAKRILTKEKIDIQCGRSVIFNNIYEYKRWVQQ